jgi:sodium transport system permease protein
MLSAIWTVFRKEWVDALRDRRTLMTVLLSAVAMGPLVLVLLSSLVSRMEQQAESRQVWVMNMQDAPTLRNFLERQTFTVRQAPPDYEQQLVDSRLGDPVVLIPKDFERDLARGVAPVVEVVSSSANQRASTGMQRVMALLQGFNRERGMLRLMVRGVSPALLQPVEVQQRDLASPAARAANLTSMLPFFVLMAVLYGALNAALDTTAGERERGSLEPLLLNPASRLSLVLGKWMAVSAVAMLIAVLSTLSFLPGQWLLHNDLLSATFRYGWREALGFLAVLCPLAGGLSALLMAIAIRAKSIKEAQASAAVLLMAVSFLPLVSTLQQGGDRPWYFWVPALGQSVLMNHILRGDTVPATALWSGVLVCAVLAVVCLWDVARRLAQAAVR